MNRPIRRRALGTVILVAAMALTAPAQSLAQTAKPSSADRWIHVRVDTPTSKGEMVRVNVPVELAEKVLPTINKDRLQGGRVRIDRSEVNGVDLRALLDAVQSSKDGEFVTVQSRDSDVRVAKQGGHVIVHVVDTCVTEKGVSKKNQVEIKVPMKVVDALLSAGKDELDLVAALHALAAQGDTELVSVKSDDNTTVRVWLDARNTTD